MHDSTHHSEATLIRDSGSNSSYHDVKPFDWQQAFPNIDQGFDVVIGNPPYLDAERMAAELPDWRRYCAKHYQSASGNWDVFCVFIEQALKLCRSGGLTSLVVPNKLLSAEYAAPARSLLSQDNRLLAIRDYSQVAAFAASVYPVVYLAQKLPPPPAPTTCYEMMASLDRVKHRTILPSLHASAGSKTWLIAQNSQQSQLMTRLQHNFPPLSQVAQVTGAATVAEAYALQPHICDAVEPQAGLRLVNSGTIDRFCSLWGKKPLRYLGQSFLRPMIPGDRVEHLPVKRYQQAQQPKILVAGMTRSLECMLDATGGILAGKSTSVIQIIQTCDLSIDLRYLLGLLNSRLINYFFSVCFGGNRLNGGYLRVGPPQLRQIPICVPRFEEAADRDRYDQIIKWADQRLLLQQKLLDSDRSSALLQQIDELEQAIDRVIYELYQLPDAEIALISQRD